MAVNAVLRRLILVAIWSIGDLLLVSVLGPRLWPAPLFFTYKALDSFDFRFPKTICFLSRFLLYTKFTVTTMVTFVASAKSYGGFWWRAGLFSLPIMFRESKAGIVYLFLLPKWGKRIHFVTAWMILERSEPLSPAALGTLLVHTACLRTDYGLVRIACFVACCACIGWSIRWLWRELHPFLLSRMRFTAGDRLILMPFITIYCLICWARLAYEVSWVSRDLNFWSGGSRRKAHAWIASRVEEEMQKVTANHLDCYVRADMLKQTPTFTRKVTDTEDLEFLCGINFDADAQKRPVREVLIGIAFKDEYNKGIVKDDATSVLAHLTFLEGLDLHPEAQQALVIELIRRCRAMLDGNQASWIGYLGPIEAALAGLGNLAKGNEDIGSFIKGERLFSIIVALVNPSTPFVRSLVLQGEDEEMSFERFFEERDPGYSESDLSRMRRKYRASARHNDSARRHPASKERAGPPLRVAEELDSQNTLMTDSGLTLICTYYAVSRFLGRLQLQSLDQAALLRKFQVGAWYRLLSLGVRLMSSLSTVESNHVWLLEQGALQALHRMLQLLPADRMRSGQQEAALFIYRVFENSGVRTFIHNSPALKAAASELVLELRAIDSDLFGDGWSHRIGRPLYGELVPATPSTADAQAETTSEEATSSSTRRAHPPSSRRCSREGCQVEERHGVRLKICAGCQQVRYCSKECQIADYPAHKVVCKPS